MESLRGASWVLQPGWKMIGVVGWLLSVRDPSPPWRWVQLGSRGGAEAGREDGLQPTPSPLLAPCPPWAHFHCS